MSRKYKIRDQERLHFVTFTVVNWIDVFTKNDFKYIFLDSIEYCQKNKGLEVYAWCIMTNHVHMIVGTTGQNNLENILRDLKSFTSTQSRKLLELSALPDGRKEWMLWMMKRTGTKNGNNNDFQFWQQHNQPIELNSNEMRSQKLTYIHENPVRAGFVDSPEKWLFSSATDYYETGKGLLNILIIE